MGVTIEYAEDEIVASDFTGLLFRTRNYADRGRAERIFGDDDFGGSQAVMKPYGLKVDALRLSFADDEGDRAGWPIARFSLERAAATRTGYSSHPLPLPSAN